MEASAQVRFIQNGGREFLTDEPIRLHTYEEEKIDIHHIFPQKWITRSSGNVWTASSIKRRSQAEPTGSSAVIPSPGLSRVSVDPGQINQVLMNLALNARDAMSQGGELTIATRDVDFAAATQTVQPEMRPGRYVLLAVTDTGCGMAPGVLARIFEPFFSTKSDNTGLGLSVVDGIVKQNGGYLAVTSRPGFGTTFSIYLPTVEGTTEGLPPKPLSKPVAGNETILLVEDEDPVREVTALLLESLGYQVLQVSNAKDALNLVENTRAKIDLLFTDVIMPGMSGRELVEALRLRDPGLKVLFQSGYTDDIVIRHGILRAEVAFLQKPFTVDALAKKIRERLDQK